MKAEDIAGICYLLFVTGFALATGILAIFHVAKTADQWQETQLRNYDEQSEENNMALYVDAHGTLHETFANPV